VDRVALAPDGRRDGRRGCARPPLTRTHTRTHRARRRYNPSPCVSTSTPP
jgi:hypothetical protein